MSDGAGHRDVIQLDALAGFAQQQASAGHVAAANEINRKPEALAEYPAEDADVLRRRDASEQHHVAGVSDLAEQRHRAALERLPIADVREIDVAVREFEDGRVGDPCVGTLQSCGRRDDVDVAGRGELPRVRQLAAEVEAAEEREDVAERRAPGRPELRCQGRG